jgi:hypothetical protein
MWMDNPATGDDPRGDPRVPPPTSSEFEAWKDYLIDICLGIAGIACMALVLAAIWMLLVVFS